MVDREKVIMGFTRHIDTACEFCPYDDSNTCTTDLCKDVLELLKEQQETTIESLQGTIRKLLDALEEYPEIVRCKNCKNAVVCDDSNVICTHIGSNGSVIHPIDWFCANGKRR